MALGIEPNNVAPQLIQNSGQALVQGIRQIGQQISGHLTELQTKRDLGGLAMEMQGVNPASTEFPVQLTQLVAKHPLAARDERGQMLLGILGKAHGQWQASQADALAFERQMKMLETREAGAAERAAATDARRANEIVSIPKVGGVLRGLGPGGKPVVAVPLPEDAEEFRSGSLGTYSTKTGLGPDGKPLPRKPASSGVTQKRMVIQSQLQNLNSDLDLDLKEHQRLLKEEEAIKKELEDVDDEKKKADLEYRRSVKALDAEKALKKVNETRAKKLKLAEDLGMLLEDVEPELGMVPPNAVAPPIDDPNALVAVINPQGKSTNIKRSQLEAALQSGYKQR